MCDCGKLSKSLPVFYICGKLYGSAHTHEVIEENKLMMNRGSSTCLSEFKLSRNQHQNIFYMTYGQPHGRNFGPIRMHLPVKQVSEHSLWGFKIIDGLPAATYNVVFFFIFFFKNGIENQPTESAGWNIFRFFFEKYTSEVENTPIWCSV